ncbi:helix-turn-helix transcriptional regulator [Polaromonas sp. YR568]|uniref:helix-turn-helix transcriptional regulator n=1 Tax=Polaromonas sp. YR568 TaxID=1855301 RepID=UPI00398C1A2D
MSTNTLNNPIAQAAQAAQAAPLTLGGFLRDRRARLPPAPGADGRRRTPGLRREEVATRAHVSVTWYTWLEQGRGGPPSDEVLERLAGALALDGADREYMFLLARQRPPPLRGATSSAAVTPALQRVLDGLTASPAIVKTQCWDIVAWNAAAAAVLSDYAAQPPGARNLLRRLFTDPAMRSLPDWEANARFALAAFRVDAARAGDSPEAAALAEELQAASKDFRRLWADNETSSHYGGVKQIERPLAGAITLEYQSFPVDSAAGLSMIVFTPVTPADVEAVALLMANKAGPLKKNGKR